MSKMGIRYSFTLALVTMVGICINMKKLRYGDSVLIKQEYLLLLFLLLVLIFSILKPETVGRYSTVDSPSVKLLKVAIFLLMMTHVVTDKQKLDGLFWTMIIASLILGLQSYNMPRSAFVQGRLEGIGGADFGDSNRFGGFMAGMLFIIGVQFLNSGKAGKLLCFVAGGFTANAVVLTRSRGALLGIAGGMLAAAIFAPKKYRIKLILAMVLAGIGVFSLTDERAVERIGTITAEEEERDSSAQSRLEIWHGGMKMLLDNPLFGVGPGNFYQNIGKYQPKHPGRDAHNTFVRCGGELGLPGITLFVLIIVNAILMLSRCIKACMENASETRKDLMWKAYGGMTGMAAMITYGMTGTLVYTEFLWWMLMLPVCIERTYQNEITIVDEGR